MLRTLGVCLSLVVTFGTGVAVSAGGSMQIRKIAFDPRGPDDGTNRHLRKEFVYLVNAGDSPVQMRGWKVVEKVTGRVFKFRSLYLAIPATPSICERVGVAEEHRSASRGLSVRTNAHYDEYWDRDDYVWENDGDAAILKNDAGDVVDRCGYPASADSPKRC